MAVTVFYPQLLCTFRCLQTNTHTRGEIEIMYIYTALIVGKVANDVANLGCFETITDKNRRANKKKSRATRRRRRRRGHGENTRRRSIETRRSKTMLLEEDVRFGQSGFRDLFRVTVSDRAAVTRFQPESVLSRGAA